MNHLFQTLIVILSFAFCQVSNAQKQDTNAKAIQKYLIESGKYLHSDRPELSLQNAKKALSLAIKSNDEASIAKAYNFIGLNFVEIYDYDKVYMLYSVSSKYLSGRPMQTVFGILYWYIHTMNVKIRLTGSDLFI